MLKTALALLLAATCAQAQGTRIFRCGNTYTNDAQQAQVDLLKAKIQKAWGAKMEKAADEYPLDWPANEDED